MRVKKLEGEKLTDSTKDFNSRLDSADSVQQLTELEKTVINSGLNPKDKNYYFVEINYKKNYLNKGYKPIPCGYSEE